MGVSGRKLSVTALVGDTFPVGARSNAPIPWCTHSLVKQGILSVLYIKNGDFAFGDFQALRTQTHPGRFLCIYSYVSFGVFLTCIFVQHNKNFLNSNVSGLGRDLRRKLEDEVGIKNDF